MAIAEVTVPFGVPHPILTMDGSLAACNLLIEIVVGARPCVMLICPRDSVLGWSSDATE